MIVIQKNVWAAAVVERINSTSAGLLYEALQATADEEGVGHDQIPDPSVDPWGALEWMRQDETADEYESGTSAYDYADFLTTEWDLHGFLGE